MVLEGVSNIFMIIESLKIGLEETYLMGFVAFTWTRVPNVLSEIWGAFQSFWSAYFSRGDPVDKTYGNDESS